MKNKIIPRGKWLLVKSDNPEERQTRSGLLMPSSSEQEQKAQGEVVAVGDEPKGIKKGDRVIYGAYAGEDLEIQEGAEKMKFKLLLEEDVIAFIK